MHIARDLLRAAVIVAALVSSVRCALASTDEVLGAIHVPDGFTVETAAEAPLVKHPMWACFDDRGRLFVAESGGANLNSEQLLKDPPSSILLLEDTKGDGHFDKSTVFADKMVFPQGVCWHDGALYVASPPYLWRLRDTKGTGVADERTPLVGKFGFTGNAADIHGPVLGPDGRLYWCDGRHGHEIQMPGGQLSNGLAARIFRCKPDGSDVEVVCGGGMDNPVQVAFTEAGEPLVSCNIVHSRPQRIDGILYALEGAVFPWNEVIDEFKSTGELFEPVDPLGWVAVSGLIRYRGGAFGKEYRDNFFSAQFNPHRIQRHTVERDGAGFRVRHEDFLTCDDPDFHPTALVEDADGSLLLIDTGGWFRIGCPNSRIAKPQINGAIYRIRRKDAPDVVDPRGLKIDWGSMPPAQLARLLDDPRPFVLDRVIDTLALRGTDAIDALSEVLRGRTSVGARRNAIWALARIDSPAARQTARSAMGDADASVRQAAAQVSGLFRDTSATPDLIKRLADDSLPVRRDAATALGRIGRADASAPLIAALRGNGDRYLEHAIIYALIRIADARPLVAALGDADPSVRQGALLALDQIDGSGLLPDQVLPLLDPGEPRLKDAALSVIARHPGWGDRTRDFFRQTLSRPIDPALADTLRQELVSFSASPGVQELIASVLSDPQTEPETRRLLLQVIAQYPQRLAPASWTKQIGKSIKSNQDAVAQEAVLSARSLGLMEVDPQLLQVACQSSRPEALRVEAFSVAAPRVAKVDSELFELLSSCLHSDRPPLLRAEAAEALGRSNLDDTQLEALARLAASAGPMELPKLLPAFGRRPSDAAGKELIAALDHAPGLTSLRPEDLKASVAMDSAGVQAMAEPLLKRLAPDAAGQKAHLAELAPVLSGGDAARGRDLFFGPKAGCATCHTIGGRGGQVGPDLSKIGSIRSSADLLESIVYPSASFARGFEPYTVRTTNGDVQAGIIARETADSIYLTTGPRQVVRLPRPSIDTIRPGTVSLMPQGFDQLLSHGELSDVIAYLTSLK
jgi:putative membrane-bound dehydrogenase-like protein